MDDGKTFVQSLSHVRLFVTPWLQHASLPCPSPAPEACSNSCSLSQWCHPTISSSVIHFSSCLQSFPASWSFPMSQFFAAPWTVAHQAPLSFTVSWSLFKLMFIESVMPSNHLSLCRHLLPPSIFPSIRVFSKEKTDFSHQLVKVLEYQLQHQSFQWIFRTAFL